MTTKKNFLERGNDDFPFYQDASSPLNFKGMLIIILSSLIGFMLFTTTNIPFIAPFLNVIFPLGALIFVTKNQWTKIFRKLVPNDVLVIIGTLVANIAITFVIGLLVTTITGSSDANPASTQFDGNFSHAVPFFLKTIPMLFGEELLTILPFLIILKLGVQQFNLSRKSSLLLAWLLTSLLFAALHFPTYNWNILQTVLTIGTARLILTFSYIKTKNIWVSFIVHLLNDWVLFGLAFLASTR